MAESEVPVLAEQLLAQHAERVTPDVLQSVNQETPIMQEGVSP